MTPVSYVLWCVPRRNKEVKSNKHDVREQSICVFDGSVSLVFKNYVFRVPGFYFRSSRCGGSLSTAGFLRRLSFSLFLNPKRKLVSASESVTPFLSPSGAKRPAPAKITRPSCERKYQARTLCLEQRLSYVHQAQTCDQLREADKAAEPSAKVWSPL